MLRSIGSLGPRKDAPVEFSKMSGAGNDFVVIDNRAGTITSPEEFARKICTRRLSVGADGLILIESSPRATFRMRYFNSDGSLADFCANGTRCAARFAFINVIAPRKMTIETGAGVVGAEVQDQLVTLSLPSPRSFASLPLRVASGMTIDGSRIVAGVPHYVIFLRDELWSQQIEALGRELRFHPGLAPEGANVNFVVVNDAHAIEVRTYERGVEGETLACGSGVVSSACVSALFGRVSSPVSVTTRSGIVLRVSFNLKDETFEDLKLTGDARVVFKAQILPETIDGFDADWVRNPTSLAREP